MRAEAILARQLHGSQRQGVKAGNGVYYTAGAAMKKFVLVMPLLALAVAMSCVTVKSSDSGAEGDKKIKDTIEDTRKKEAQARKEQRERRKQEEAQEASGSSRSPGILRSSTGARARPNGRPCCASSCPVRRYRVIG
jgi:hypothetical protein